MPRQQAIVYYSQDSHTQPLAHQLASWLQADIFRVFTPCYRIKRFSYLCASFDSLIGRLPTVPRLPNLSGYESVSIGSHIWTSFTATPARYLLMRFKLSGVVGFFVTSGAQTVPERAFQVAQDLFDRQFSTTLIIKIRQTTPQPSKGSKFFSGSFADRLMRCN